MEETWFLITKERYRVGNHYYNHQINLSDPWEPFSGGFILVPYSELLCHVWRDGNCYRVETPDIVNLREIDGLNYIKTGCVKIESDAAIDCFQLLVVANRKIKNRAIAECVKNNSENMWNYILDRTKDENLFYLALLKAVKIENVFAIESLIKKGRELNIHLEDTHKNAIKRKSSCKSEEVKKTLESIFLLRYVEQYSPSLHISVLVEFSRNRNIKRKSLIFKSDDRMVTYSAVLGVDTEIDQTIHSFEVVDLEPVDKIIPVDGALKDIHFIDCPLKRCYFIKGEY